MIAPTAPCLPGLYPRTDTGNAERFVFQHAHHARYLYDENTWICWDGKRWKRDASGQAVEYAKQTARSILEEAHQAEDQDAREKLTKHSRASENAQRIKSMLTLAQSDERVSMPGSLLDREPFRVVCQNGEVDLFTGSIEDHNPDHLCSRITPVTYDPHAECPVFERFVAEILAGDADLIDFTQRAAGYTLTGDTSEQCLFMLHGPGSNGKSTLLETLVKLLGDYAVPVSGDLLLQKDRNGGPSPELVQLRGARFTSAIETGEGRRLDETLVKTLTGQDTISARDLYAKPIRFRAAFKLWLATNHRPDIRGTDDAIWRRIRLIPFDVSIPEERRNQGLGDALERELDGIFAWAARGARAWMADGLGAPPAVATATSEYRGAVDILGAFITDTIALDQHATTPKSTVYHAYRAWCERTGEKPWAMNKLGMRLHEKGWREDPARRAGRSWAGIKLRGGDDT